MQKVYDMGVQSQNQAAKYIQSAKDALSAGNAKDADRYFKDAQAYMKAANENISTATGLQVQGLDQLNKSVDNIRQGSYIAGDTISKVVPGAEIPWKATKDLSNAAVEVSEHGLKGGLVRAGAQAALDEAVDKGTGKVLEGVAGSEGIVGRPPKYVDTFLSNPERVGNAAADLSKNIVDSKITDEIKNKAQGK